MNLTEHNEKKMTEKKAHRQPRNKNKMCVYFFYLSVGKMQTNQNKKKKNEKNQLNASN